VRGYLEYVDEQAGDNEDEMNEQAAPKPIPTPIRKPLINVESDLLPASPLVKFLRWYLPAALCILGVVLLFVEGFNTAGVDAFAAFAGAGSSIWLINVLWRIGITGDEERDVEAEDRIYLQQHGHWPDEDKS
jgi:hypothetical protein